MVRIDPEQLESALLNICLNAGHAHADRISIQVETCDMQTVRVSISDNGDGVSAETVARAFEPFYVAFRYLC